MKKTTRRAGAETEVRTWHLSDKIPESYRYVNMHRKAIVLLYVPKSVILRIKKILTQNLLRDIGVDFEVFIIDSRS